MASPKVYIKMLKVFCELDWNFWKNRDNTVFNAPLLGDLWMIYSIEVLYEDLKIQLMKGDWILFESTVMELLKIFNKHTVPQGLI